MKIRAGFVTNSSSTSYMAISITSEPLAEIMRKSECLADHFDSFDVEGDCVSMNGVDLDSAVPGALSEVMDNLIEFLCGILDVWLEDPEEESEEESEDNGRNLILELEKRKKELQASIKEVDWLQDDGGWGGDSDIRMYPDQYSKETLQRIYAAIAKEKGCAVEDVTEDDFAAYAAERSSADTRHFTYSQKDGGQGEYTQSFELV